MNVTVELSGSRPDGLPDRNAFTHWTSATLRTLQLPGEDYGLCIALLDEAESAALNSRWRGRSGPTNILSFPIGDAAMPETSPRLLGDLAICPSLVFREAAEQHKTAEAHFAHLTVHGILHLQGYDHETPEEADVMEALETRIVTALGFAPPYE